MFKRYWHIGFAVGLSLCFALSVQGKPKDDTLHRNGEDSGNGSITQAIKTKVDSADASEDSAGQPKSGKDSKFDLDRRSVEANEKSARWTKYGVYVGAAGIVFVIATLGVSIWQGTVARRAYISEHRPKIRFWAARIEEILPETPIDVKIVLINAGATLAKEVCASLNLITTSVGQNTHFGPESVAMGDIILASQDKIVNWQPSFQLPIEDTVNIRSGAATLAVTGSIFYKDMNGAVRRTGVYRVYNMKTRRFDRVQDGHPHADKDFEA